jgi:hypothetical protein
VNQIEAAEGPSDGVVDRSRRAAAGHAVARKREGGVLDAQTEGGARSGLRGDGVGSDPRVHGECLLGTSGDRYICIRMACEK